MGREQQLSDAFVGLADTLGDDFDVIDLFERLAAHCVELSGAEAVGIMMSDGRGGLRAIAASQERAALIELLQLQTGKGPCVECYTGGSPVIVPRAEAMRARWPELVPALLEAGFGAVVTVPLRLHDDVIGAVNLFYARPDPAVAADLHLVQALSDIAALAMLHWPAQRIRSEDILARLQATITNKVAVEQAKGVLAESGGFSVAEAAEVLRSYARVQQMRVTDVARAVVRRTLSPETVLAAASYGRAGESGMERVSGK